MRKLIKGDDKIIDGICSGFANYFNIDVFVIRALFVFIGLFVPLSMVLFYIIMIFIIPEN